MHSYTKIKPHKKLTALIECYYIWEGHQDHQKDIQSPPNSFCAIVFNSGDPCKAYQGVAKPMEVPKNFISGQFTSNYHIVLKGTIHMIGVVIKPTALFNFFGLQMPAMTNSRVDLQLLIPECMILAETLVQGIHADEVKRILDDFFIALLPSAIHHLSFIDQAIAWMDEKKGVSTVDELAGKLHVSRRYFEKKFLEKTGISPKFYMRVKRFSVLSNVIAHQRHKPDWQQILQSAGYHDQSHFIKEFLEFNGMTPNAYFENHQEMVRLLNYKTNE